MPETASRPFPWGEPLRQAWLDFAHDWRVSACLVLALAAVLAPLLIFFGLRYGLVETMSQRLVEDPRNREIVPIGSGQFSESWFAETRARPEVAFVQPRTRAIAASMQLVSRATRKMVEVDLMTSGEGDPILGSEISPPSGLKTIILSYQAARKLGLDGASIIEGIITRRRDGRSERVSLPISVGGILPLRISSREMAWVSLELMVAAEDYRDGRAVAALGGEGEPIPDTKRIFAGFRLFARSIYDVPTLSRELQSEGTEVHTRTAEIENLMALDRNLSQVFWIIAAVATTGYAASLSVSLWAGVERKRRQLSVLRLLGFARSAIVIVPVAQAAMTAVLGWTLAIGLFALVERVINGMYFSILAPGEAVCRLEPVHLVLAAFATLTIAMPSAAIAAFRAASIDPAEGLRDV